ncbi:MAG: hypothetical protein KDC98_04835 [Planctomycetes bacterium]|nr:hypothetical protein [Planctomycetota bacterium]
MRSGVAALCLLIAGCQSMAPAEFAAAVAAMPGGKPLRVGVVVLGNVRALPEAFAQPPAAPGGAASPPVDGTLYAERTLLPESVPAENVVAALQQLGAFTDVVPLPFDSRGIASREAVVQRIQDRIWRLAIEQKLDALLVLEGLRDGGLRWSDAGEGLFTLDTAMWWLVWPIGLWIPDRTYTADCELVAEMFWLGDAAADPQPVLFGAKALPHALTPWQRADLPLLGLVLPPAWVGDDPVAVANAVRDRARDMLPIELVRNIKLGAMPGPDAEVELRLHEGHYDLEVRSSLEVIAATITGLPRGALTDASAVTPLPVPLVSEMELLAKGPRHATHGRIESAAVEQAAPALVRVVVELVSGERISRTWAIAELLR